MLCCWRGASPVFIAVGVRSCVNRKFNAVDVRSCVNRKFNAVDVRSGVNRKFITLRE
jgi:hypothetical protein